MAFLPDGRLLFTEKETGALRIVAGRAAARPSPVATFPVDGEAERGLLGIAVDPDFERDPWIYVAYSDEATGRNVIDRVRIEGGTAGETERLLVGLPSSAGYHNGGDLVFGSDGMLYATLGEAHDPARAQDADDLGGKVVRLRPDGSIPEDNPFGPGNPVWSMGHRNSFGLCVDPSDGTLWSTENGPDRDDEINRIDGGGNYGWPAVTGMLDPGAGIDNVFVDPIAVFSDPVALTGCAVVDGDVWPGPTSRGSSIGSIPAPRGERGVGGREARRRSHRRRRWVRTGASTWRRRTRSGVCRSAATARRRRFDGHGGRQPGLDRRRRRTSGMRETRRPGCRSPRGRPRGPASSRG